MSWLLFAVLTAACLVMLVHGLAERGRFLQFPFLAAAAFLAFIVPQIPGLVESRFLPEAATAKTLFLSVLCLLMCWVGWNVGMRSSAPSTTAFSERRLLHVALVLSLAGAYFYHKFGELPDDERLRGMLTGTAVAYLFFAKLLTYGLAIALLCFMQRPSRLALAIIAFDALFVLERIFIAGRRSETAEFLLLIALALWFQKRWAVPRAAMAAGVALGLLSTLVAEEYRQATHYSSPPDWDAIARIDIGEKWDRLLMEGGSEMRNAVMAIDRIDREKTFNYGMGHWNSLVFAYVPAQLVGNSIKNALVIPVPEVFERDYAPTTGSTATGMTDAFASFWFFGCLKFFAIALVLGWVYASAMRGNTIMQLVYMLSAMPSILVITHFTNEIVIAWVHIAIFFIPALLYSRVRTSRPVAGSPGVSQLETVAG